MTSRQKARARLVKALGLGSDATSDQIITAACAVLGEEPLSAEAEMVALSVSDPLEYHRRRTHKAAIQGRAQR